MSAETSKTTSLAAGYSRKHHDCVPRDLILLIATFYNKYCYWTVKGDKLKKFLSTKNCAPMKIDRGDQIKQFAAEEHIKSTLLKIKDIEFECKLYPNGWNEHEKGYIQMWLGVKNVPSDIEYFIMSAEIGCDSTPCTSRCIVQWSEKGKFVGSVVGKLLDCIDMTQIEFHCMIDILAIKYYKYAKKLDYKMEYSFNKHVEYVWKLDDKLSMERIRNPNQEPLGLIESEPFDNNNWVISILPEASLSSVDLAELAIYVGLLRWPHGISAFDATYSIKVVCASEEIYGGEKKKCKIISMIDTRGNQDPFGGSMQLDGSDVNINAMLKQKWIKIEVEIDVTDIFVDDRLIQKNEWHDYGFV